MPFLVNFKTFTDEEGLSVHQQRMLSEALEYLYSHGFAYAVLRPSNLMGSEDWSELRIEDYDDMLYDEDKDNLKAAYGKIAADRSPKQFKLLFAAIGE